MTLKPGMFWPLVLIDLGVGIGGFFLALGWGKVSRRTLDQETTAFLAKVFGGISLVFLVVIFLAR